MSKVFYEKVIGFFLNFVVLLILIGLASLWLIFYVVFDHIIFYFFHFGLIFLAVFYGIKCYGKFRNFQETIHLFIPKETIIKEKPNPELKMKFDEECLDVCLKYRNGMTYRKIAAFYGDLEPQSVVYRLRKGLGILLKEYAKNHKHKEVKPT